MGIVGFINFMFLIDSPELVGMQHEVTASNPESATNYRRIDDSDESEGEPDVMVRSENSEQVKSVFVFLNVAFSVQLFLFLACNLNLFIFSEINQNWKFRTAIHLYDLCVGV